MARILGAVTEVVAIGSFSQIERWAELLRNAGIPFVVRWSSGEHGTKQEGRAEIWVDRQQVDYARSAIRVPGMLIQPSTQNA